MPDVIHQDPSIIPWETAENVKKHNVGMLKKEGKKFLDPSLCRQSWPAIKRLDLIPQRKQNDN